MNNGDRVVKEGFKGVNMMQVYVEIRPKLPSCRINNDDENGQMVVTVNSEEDISVMRSLSDFGGVRARVVARKIPYWGRISGVPVEINE